MKKYKIGKRLISAETPVQAIKIVKLLDSSVVKASMKDVFNIVPGATFKSRSSDDPWVIRILSVDDLGFVNFQTMQKIGNRFANGGIETRHIDKLRRLFESRYRQTNSIYDDDNSSEIEYLTKEEEQAVEDYRNAIKKTSNPKLLKVYAHILKEETEHIQELQEADVEDSVKDIDIISGVKLHNTSDAVKFVEAYKGHAISYNSNTNSFLNQRGYYQVHKKNGFIYKTASTLEKARREIDLMTDSVKDSDKDSEMIDLHASYTTSDYSGLKDYMKQNGLKAYYIYFDEQSANKAEHVARLLQQLHFKTNIVRNNVYEFGQSFDGYIKVTN